MTDPIQEHEALLVFQLVRDAMAALTLDADRELPLEVREGIMLMADEMLGRIWPLINLHRIGQPACHFRWRIATTAAAVCRRHL